MLKKAAALALVGASLTMWVGCTSNSSQYLYATIPASNQIVAFREDPNSGVLTVLSGSPITAGTAVESIAIHPSKKFLYAANSGSSNVSLFTISSNGALAQSGTPANTGISPTLLAMDSAGSFLYVANTGSANISVFSIDSGSGALSEVVGSPFSTSLPALNMKLSPAGNVLYVTLGGSPGYIEVFSLDPGGQTLANLIQYLQPGTNPYGLAIDPSGTHLYTANTQDNSIGEYTIGTDGSLTQVLGSPIGQTFAAPIALLVDPSGKYLYVANEGSSNLSAYGVGSDGGLTLLTNSPFATAKEPTFITSDPLGKYLFVGNQSGAVIQSFSLDGSTGTLTSVHSYSVGGTPTSIAVTP